MGNLWLFQRWGQTVLLAEQARTPTFLAKTRKQLKFEHGYTLLEVLVVLAIIGLATASAPAIYGQVYPSFQLRQFSNDLANHLRGLREKARFEGSIESFHFGERGLVVADTQLDPPEDIIVSYEVNEFWGNANRSRVSFFPNGSSDGGEISLRKGNIEIVVKIDWVSGAVEVIQ